MSDSDDDANVKRENKKGTDAEGEENDSLEGVAHDGEETPSSEDPSSYQEEESPLIPGHTGQSVNTTGKQLLLYPRVMVPDFKHTIRGMEEQLRRMEKYTTSNYLILRQWAKKSPRKATWVVCCTALILIGSPLAAAFLSAFGFTSAGVAAGSLAAGWHSSIGVVTAGSIFSFLQSIAATGAIFGIGAGLGVGIGTAGLLAVPDVRDMFAKFGQTVKNSAFEMAQKVRKAGWQQTTEQVAEAMGNGLQHVKDAAKTVVVVGMVGACFTQAKLKAWWNQKN